MRIFFEEYSYDKDLLNQHLACSIEASLQGDGLYQYLEKQKKVKFTCVGYFYNSIINDSIFVLPKVFLNIDKNNPDETIVFSSLENRAVKPEDIINISSSSIHPDTLRFINNLSLYIYQSIERYSSQFGKGNIIDGNLQRVVTTPGESTETWLDTVVSMIKFYKEHRNLFTFIKKNRDVNASRINWKKTINRKIAIISDDEVPFYSRVISCTKTINFEEELIVLFLSTMNYLRNTFSFSKIENIGYDLLRPTDIQHLIDSGKGVIKIKSLRNKYFTDELVQLWNLMKLFFIQSFENKNKKSDNERTIIKKYDRVFEHMIDCLVGDSLPKALKYMKNQDDGKNIDHIYLDKSIIPSLNNQIFFIGDSKYYKETEENGSSKIGKNSISKQFTYARNVIQYCINLTLNGADSDIELKDEEEHLLKQTFYRDDLTEGYNITPNFFIHGRIFNDYLSDNNLRYNIHLVPDELIRESKQWNNRLFDRDTLIIQTFNINFLYVLQSYVLRAEGEITKKEIRSVIRKTIIEQLDSQFLFIKVFPTDIKQFVDMYFRKYVGQMISFKENSDNENSSILIFAFKKPVNELVKIEELNSLFYVINNKTTIMKLSDL